MKLQNDQKIALYAHCNKLLGTDYQRDKEKYNACSIKNKTLSKKENVFKNDPSPRAQIAQSSLNDPINHYGIGVIYIRSETEVKNAIADLLESRGVLALDIETYPQKGGSGLDPFSSEIRLMQIYDGGKHIYVFDLKNIPIDVFPSDLWKRPIICHNALFELKHLLHRNCPLENIGCTMLMAFILKGRAITAGLSLKKLAYEYLGIELSKEEQLSDWSKDTLTQKQINYAAIDALVTYHLFQNLRKLTKEKGLSRAYEARRDAQMCIAKMMLKGLYLNTDKHSKLIKEWKGKELLYKQNVLDYLGNDINLNSSKQLGVCLEKNLSKDILDKWPRTDKGALCTQSKIILRYSDRLNWGEDYKYYKNYAKKLSTYGESLQSFVHPKTGRIHPDILLSGTDTGRMSSRNPNSQNFPRMDEFRSLFEAPKGKILLVADYSQIELRVASIVTKDKVMKESYEKGLDLHRKTASAITGIEEEKITKDQRQLAKAVNFGFLYGQEAKGFVNYARDIYGVTLSYDEAVEAKEKFLTTYKELKEWQLDTRADAKRTLQVATPLGYVRHFDDQKKTYNQSLNTPIQGGGAEVMLRALYFLNLSLDWSKSALINCVHDELILECDDDYIEEGSQILKDTMIKGFLDVFPDETINNLVTVTYGLNWQEAK